MADQVTNYQCPACEGPLRFDGTTGKLKCDHCDSSFTVEEIEIFFEKKNTKAKQTFSSLENSVQNSDDDAWGKDGSGMKAYNCPSCGAELICDATTAATRCPFCGNPSIVPGQFGGTLKPDFIIPFKIEKKAAITALTKHYKGKKFLPKSFIKGNNIEEVRGVYVPFWLFDGNCDADITFEATKSRTHSSGDEVITITDYYNVYRSGAVTYEKIPVDASTKMPDEHMDSIEPFSYEEMKPFSTAFMPGFLADKYDVSVDDSKNRAEERAKNLARESMKADVKGYSTCKIKKESITVNQGNVKYAMLPVWMLCTKWKGKDFLFAMNGQTGKLIGNLPVSVGKVFAWFFGIAIPVAAILTVVMLGRWG